MTHEDCGTGVIYPEGTDWLSPDELAILSALGSSAITWTPGQLAHHTGKTRQHCARITGILVRLGLASRNSLPKQTSYEITGEGRAVLEAGTS